MGYNSKAYLAYEEAKANGVDQAHGTRQREQEQTTMAAKWRWIDSLTPDQRKMLKQEFENENKTYNHD